MARRLPNSLSEVAFRDAWNDSRDKSPTRPGAPGIDRISAQEFRSQLETNIRLTRRLIQTGGYQFKRLRVAPIPKASGGERIIAIPTVQDRLVQRVLLHHLEGDPRFPRSSSIAYGFAKGRSLPDAQRRAMDLRRSARWVVQSDIIKFFDRIRRGQLKARVQKAVRSKIVAALVEEARIG
jgi:RNA-directed DNA polymerase